MSNYNYRNEENPMFTKRWVWLWIVCFPLALILVGHFESKKDMAKWKQKQLKKEQAFLREYPEFDWWQDNQGL